jgi:tetratricopeptide (TPR) repeat protein
MSSRDLKLCHRELPARTPRQSRPLRGRIAAAAVFLWVTGLLLAPAAHAADAGGRRLQQGDYAGAVTLLQAQQASRPRSVRLERELGIALLKSGDAAGAVTALRAASKLEPRNRATLYYLGSAAEVAGDSTLALDAYGACLAIGGPGLGPVRARVDALRTAQLKRAVAKALATEPQLTLDTVPLNTVVVPEFGLADGSESLRPICRGLAAILEADLRKVPHLRLVERERLPLLMRELAPTDGRPGGGGPRAVDPATAPRLGRLLGARRFAQGAVMSLGPERLELRGSVIDAGAGELHGTGAPLDGPVTAVLDLEKRLVFQVLDTLGVHVDARLRRAISAPAAHSYEAFVAYSRGLDFEARGFTSEAAAAYSEAYWLDPKFTLAEERLDVVSDSTGRAELEERLLGEALEVRAAGNEGTGANSQQRSTDALGFGPTTGTLTNPGSTTRVDDPTRMGTNQPLPGFPNPPRRTAAPGGPRR